jgi:mitotic spindle assembly checkpoint protein MAD1
VKEAEYLRAQLKTFDVEETMLMENNNFDSQRSEQVKQLESLVDQYKAEIQTLHNDLSKQETSLSTPTALEPRGTKRSATDENAEDDTKSQLGALLRKNKNLQTALQKITSQNQLLATEYQATKSQLKALRNSSKTRVLELRDNPTAQAEAIKMNTLRTLKLENESLMKALRGQNLEDEGIKTIPLSSLDAIKLDLAARDASIKDKEKSLLRQREIWTEKAAEFRDVIASVLGYRVIFMPNGKVKISSIFYKPQGREDPEDVDDPDDYIMFDGEKGTMKISGGNDGEFGQEVKELVDFWVKDRKEIPCFLAAMTLEFYEKFGDIHAEEQ